MASGGSNPPPVRDERAVTLANDCCRSAFETVVEFRCGECRWNYMNSGAERRAGASPAPSSLAQRMAKQQTRRKSFHQNLVAASAQSPTRMKEDREAVVAELADAPDSESGDPSIMQVRLLPTAMYGECRWNYKVTILEVVGSNPTRFGKVPRGTRACSSAWQEHDVSPQPCRRALECSFVNAILGLA